VNEEEKELPPPRCSEHGPTTRTFSGNLVCTPCKVRERREDAVMLLVGVAVIVATLFVLGHVLRLY
jgi:hypothetical protein